MNVEVPRSPLVDHVIAAFQREDLSAALVAIHRAGFGAYARVLDGTRANAAQQLARTGLHLLGQPNPRADAILLVVTAPGRTVAVADLFVHLGAKSIAFASRMPIAESAVPGPDPILPDVRTGGDATPSAEA